MIRVSFVAALLMSAVATVSTHAGTINLTPQVDNRLYDTGGDGTFDTTINPNPSLSIRTFLTIADDPFQERSVMEFGASGIPTGAVVTSASFQFQIVGYANSDTRVDIYAYTGNGQATLGDATAAAVLVGSYDPVALGLGVHTISLNGSALANLFQTSAWVGLRFQGIESTNTQINSIEGAASLGRTAPTLILEVETTPEPASLTMAGLAALGVAGFALRKRRKA